jgi:hypothetical protein
MGKERVPSASTRSPRKGDTGNRLDERGFAGALRPDDGNLREIDINLNSKYKRIKR